MTLSDNESFTSGITLIFLWVSTYKVNYQIYKFIFNPEIIYN